MMAAPIIHSSSLKRTLDFTLLKGLLAALAAWGEQVCDGVQTYWSGPASSSR